MTKNSFVVEATFNEVSGLFQHRYVLVNFAKFLRTLFLIEDLWWLLLLNVTKLKRRKEHTIQK